ncbi:hypothetical protein EG328_008914 [Venturia inaequalis]|uniref:Uncharacterized protein n=1 Tax=Venturia inaequalis TaxID=5025 RepID=A0A8H3YMN8_VENIN|nr:hypothetical protein EG328_008914 [Venturia inaequalis]KAE9992245.1 hypothetical protein EG327_009623 [Venturia inaequalis]
MTRALTAAQQLTCIVYQWEFTPETTKTVTRTTVQNEIYTTTLPTLVNSQITLTSNPQTSSAPFWGAARTTTCEGTTAILKLYVKATSGIVTRTILDETIGPGTQTITSRSTSCS